MTLPAKRFLAFCAPLLLCGGALHAQRQQRPLDDDHPRVPGAAASKEPKVKGPRAVAVLEWVPKAAVPPAAVKPAPAAAAAKPVLPEERHGAPSSAPADSPVAARLVPVAVFFQDQYQDASVYMSQPAPLAVRADDVYLVENAGDPLGFFTVRDSSREMDQWYGFGEWSALSPGESATDRSGDYEHPATHHGPAKVTVQDNDDDDDRPTLRKHQTPVKGKHKVVPEQKVEIPNPANDPDRPRLHHSAEAEDATLPELTGFPPDTRQTVAVSDAGVVDEHSFAHPWSAPQESAAAEKQIRDLAMKLVTQVPVQHATPVTVLAAAEAGAASPDRPKLQYQNATQPADANTATQDRPKLQYKDGSAAQTASQTAAQPRAGAHAGTTSRRKHAPATPPLALQNTQFAAYDLAYQDEPTYVFAGETNEPQATRRYVAVVATPDIYGNLQVAWSSATGMSQLDIAPRYRLVDAVDANGDGRAEILMEARDQQGRRFVLLEVYRGVARQIFTTGLVP